MRAISLWQPWASALVHGAKRFETRGWKIPESYLGQDLLIHAAKKRPSVDEYEHLLKWGLDVLTGFRSFDDLPFGAIIGVVTPIACYTTEDLVNFEAGEPTELGRQAGLTPREFDLGNYRAIDPDTKRKRHAWRMRDAREIKPYPYKGEQGFFEVPNHILGLARIGAR